jgi:hypothetical protein
MSSDIALLTGASTVKCSSYYALQSVSLSDQDRTEKSSARNDYARYCERNLRGVQSPASIIHATLLPLRDDLGNGVSDDDTGLLGLFLRQAGGHAYLESGYGCPASVARVDAKAEWEGFESGDEDAVC